MQQSMTGLRRPLYAYDCEMDAFGPICNIYVADADFAAARAAAAAATAHDRTSVVAYAREAVRAARDDPQHRVQLINALSCIGPGGYVVPGHLLSHP